MEKHKKYFELARKKAKLSTFERIHIGCVAVYKGKVVSYGYNTNKTHPTQKAYNCYRDLEETDGMHHTIHAEMMCLKNIPKNIPTNKIKLYIYRIRKSVPHGMCRPCPACMQRIKELGIKNVFYTTDDGFVFEKITY